MSTPSMNTNLLVRNLKRTTGRACTCGSWLEHWRRETRSRRRVCGVLGCSNPVDVGAHVLVMDNRSSWEHRIVPMCNGCNHHLNDDDMWLKSDVVAVSANTRFMDCYRSR